MALCSKERTREEGNGAQRSPPPLSKLPCWSPGTQSDPVHLDSQGHAYANDTPYGSQRRLRSLVGDCPLSEAAWRLSF